MKLCLRCGHAPIHMDNDKSIIGSMTAGLAQEFSDPDGLISRAINQIFISPIDFNEAAQQLSENIQCSHERAEIIIHQLIQSGHLEDISIATYLSDSEQERYSRSANYFAWINRENNPSHWYRQELLRTKSILILGAGGIGSGIAYHMAASGVKEITIIDFDDVELSNLNRQYLFDEYDIGKKKVNVVADKLSRINSSVRVYPYNMRIENPYDILKLSEGKDLIFRCADSPDELPYWTSDASITSRIPWIDCSYNGPVIQCCTFVPGKTGCYRCVRQAEKERLAKEGRSAVFSDHVPSTSPGFGPIVQISSALAAYEGIRFLIGLHPNSIGNAIHQNMFDYSISYTIPVPQNCSHKGIDNSQHITL